MNLIEVDDCLAKIYKDDNNSLFEFPFDIDNKTFCYFDIKDYYQFLKNTTLYEFGDIIIFNISDKTNGRGYIKIDIKINEYIIRNKHQKFWKCTNCISCDKNYIYNGGKELFEFYTNGNNGQLFFFMHFQINSSCDLNYDGNEIISSFYELKSHNKLINISSSDIDKDNEFINLISLNNFYIKENPENISINYENYFLIKVHLMVN